MGIANVKPNVNTIPSPSLPVIEPPPMQSIVSNDSYSSVLPMLLFVDGSSYTVNYYAQVLGGSSDLRELDSGQSGVYQQYNKIVGLELRVTTELSNSFNASTNMTVVTGSANVYPPLVPNVNDMFVSNIGDGKDGLFVIKRSDRKNFSRDSIYTIDYELVADITIGSGITRYTDIEAKVINTTYFYKDFLLSDKNPNLISAEYKALVDLNVGVADILKYYFKTFYNQTGSTLTVPDQLSLVYDSRLTEAVMKITVTTDAPEVRKVKLLNMDNDHHLANDSIWGALLERDPTMLDYTDNRATLVSKTAFNLNPVLEGFRFTPIQWAVYPLVTTPIINVTKSTAGSVSLTAAPAPAAWANSYATVNGVIPLIKDVLVDDYYVLSSDFYNHTTNLSLLESLVKDYLAGNAISPVGINALLTTYRKWGRLEQFYYLPILVILCNTAINGM